MAETIDIGWKVKLEGLIDGMRQSGAITEAEAKKLAAILTGAFNKAEREAAKSAKNAAKAWDKSMSAAGQAGKKVASMLGGPFAQLGDVVFELGEKLGTVGGAMGTVGVAAGGAVAAVAALAIGSKALADASVVAADRLRDAGLAAMIPAESLQSIEEYKRSTKALRTETDLLIVSMGTPFTSAIATAELALIGLNHTLQNSVVDTAAVSRTMLATATAGVSEAIGAAQGAAESAFEWATGYSSALDILADRGRKVAEIQDEMAKGHELAAKTAKQAADAVADRIKAEKTADPVLQKSTDRVVELTAEMQTELLVRRRLHEQMMASDKEIAELQAREVQIAERREEMEAAISAKRIERTEMETWAATDAVEKQIAAAKELRGAWATAGDSLVSSLASIGDSIAQNAENMTEKQKESLRDYLAGVKAATIAASILHGIASISASAQLGFPLAIPFVAAATIEAAAQTAAAIATPIPEFSTGGMVSDRISPDHRAIAARPDEAVLTGRGVRAVGGRDGVERANRGEGGAVASPVTVNLHVDGRRLATAYTDPLGSLRTGRPLGRRPLYR